MKWTNNHARESAIIYAEALLEACQKTKVADPCRALTDADEFPKLRKISEVEYAIGWLNGCAECHGVIVEVLWEQILRERPAGALSMHGKRTRIPKIKMKTDLDGKSLED
jgi:hypothetical protein